MEKILLVGGSDPSGGAGIMLDAFIAAELEAFPYAVITSIVAQNSRQVLGLDVIGWESLARQFEAVLLEGSIGAVKSGALCSEAAVKLLSSALISLGNVPFVLDPVLTTSSGSSLADDRTLSLMITSLFPKATVVTPNRREAEIISGQKIRSDEDVEKAAEIILSLGPKWVVIKGGHFKGADSVDRLFGREKRAFSHPMINTEDEVRGTGCIFATSLAVNLMLKRDIFKSIELAKDNVTKKIDRARRVGSGRLQVIPF